MAPVLLLEGLSILLVAVIFYALISGFARYKRFPHRSSLLWWGGLVGALFAFNPASRTYTVPLAILIAFVVWHYTRDIPKYQDDPGPLLLRFCTFRSVALTGAISGLMFLVLLYTLGLLQPHDFWIRAGFLEALNAVASASILGALLGVGRKAVRAKWPRPVFAPLTFSPGSDGVRTQEGQGFWADELILPVLATPFIWYFLAEIHSGWSAIFIFGLALPTWAFYLLWTFFHTSWLRWIGSVDTRDRAIFQAYEMLIKDQDIQPWLGDVIIDYDVKESRFIVSGVLPGNPELRTVRVRLNDISGTDTDTQHVKIDPELIPNPWYELAAQESVRRSRSA